MGEWNKLFLKPIQLCLINIIPFANIVRGRKVFFIQISWWGIPLLPNDGGTRQYSLTLTAADALFNLTLFRFTCYHFSPF